MHKFKEDEKQLERASFLCLRKLQSSQKGFAKVHGMILYSSISLPTLPIPAAAAMEIVCLMNRPTSGRTSFLCFIASECHLSPFC
ncbi:hypothetical protein SCA6_008862 [Theobroma cacao]